METRSTAKPNRLAGRLYALLAAALLSCLFIQFFFASMAIFVHPVHWSKHVIFVHLFEWLPIIMLLASIFGKLPGSFRWRTAALVLLIFIMYFTANARVILPFAAAAHPVIGVIMVWLSVHLFKASLQLWRWGEKSR